MKFSSQLYRKHFTEACTRTLSPGFEQWFHRLDEVTDDVVAREAAELDRTGREPVRPLRALAELGAFGVQIPQTYGGLGFGDAAACLVVERVAQGCAATAAVLMFHYQVVRRTLGCDAPWRDDDLRGFATGSLIGASAWTEATTTKNKGNLQTRLRPHGDHLLLDGEKTFCTGATTADIVHVLADATVDGTAHGPTFVRVRTKNPGVHASDPYDLLGLRASGTASLELHGVEVTAEDIVGGPGQGRRLMNTNHEVCLNPGLLALGTAAGAFEDAGLMIIGRLPGTQARTAVESVRTALADTLVRLEAAYAYAASAVAGCGPGRSPVISGKFKLQASAAADDITSTLLHAVGSRGFLALFPLERRLRDAKATALMGPSDELIRDRITDRLLTTAAPPEADHEHP